MSMFGMAVNFDRVRNAPDAGCCAMAGIKPCTRAAVTEVRWSDVYPRVKVCRQHAKQHASGPHR